MRLQGRRSSYDFSRAHHVVVDGQFVEIVSDRRSRECSAGHVSWVVIEPETRRTKSEHYLSASVLRLATVMDGTLVARDPDSYHHAERARWVREVSRARTIHPCQGESDS